MADGVGCKCGWPLDSCNPDFSDGKCGLEEHEGRYAKGQRLASKCRHCDSPIWIVYHGPSANHTLEPRQEGGPVDA